MPFGRPASHHGHVQSLWSFVSFGSAGTGFGGILILALSFSGMSRCRSLMWLERAQESWRLDRASRSISQWGHVQETGFLLWFLCAECLVFVFAVSFLRWGQFAWLWLWCCRWHPSDLFACTALRPWPWCWWWHPRCCFIFAAFCRVGWTWCRFVCFGRTWWHPFLCCAFAAAGIEAGDLFWWCAEV